MSLVVVVGDLQDGISNVGNHVMLWEGSSQDQTHARHVPSALYYLPASGLLLSRTLLSLNSKGHWML